MKKLLVLVISAAAAASLAGQSQQPDPQSPLQGPTFKTGVEVIAVDVSVVDRRGRPVSDLRAPDFAVKIDGVPRRVVSAEHVRIDVEAARREAADPVETLYTSNLRPQNGRLIVIAFDQAGIRSGSGRTILNTAAKFLDKLSPADRVAFVAYPPPGVAVDFTNDHFLLKRAMERAVGVQQRHVGVGRFNIGLYEAVAISERLDNIVFERVVARECPRLTDAALEQCQSELLLEIRFTVDILRKDASDSLRGLRDLLRQLTIIEGPKSLILLSEGLVLDRMNELDEVIEAAAVGRISINVLLMDVPRDDITIGQMRPTIAEDRDMQVQGLQNLAGGARGTLYNVLGTGENAFDQLLSGISAYYLIGVEQAPGDRDGGRHRIDVEVRRRDLTVKSRRAFVLSSATSGRRRPEDTLLDALKAPFGVAEVPLRITTFTRQDPDSAKVRVLFAAEVGQPGAASEQYTVGYVLIDAAGKVAASASEKRMLSAPAETAPLDYLREMVVEPGVYSLRFGVVDSSGRRGGVVRDVSAWKLAGEEFALGDLLIGEIAVTSAAQALRPGVEPRVRGRLGALIELHSTSAASLDAARVSFEIADDPDAPALVAEAAMMAPGPQPASRTALGVVSPELLPPGRYFARARVIRDGKVAGVLVRPFVLEAPAAAVAGPPVPMPRVALGGVVKFDPTSVLARETLAGMLDEVEKSSPALKSAIAAARSGRYSVAALEAFNAGDQGAAAFLKGLDWYAKGQLDQAATQLQIAAGPRREFFPAAFYLGASLAAGGRDRDAAGVWQLALGSQPRPALAYMLLADARLRDGQPASAIDVLVPAFERAPGDDEIARRLAMAYLMAAQYAEAGPVLDGYLSRHPTDQDALFAAVFAQYHVSARERLTLSSENQAKLARYVRAYRGPELALLQKYLDALRAP